MATEKLLSSLTHEDILRQERSLEITGLDGEIDIYYDDEEPEEEEFLPENDELEAEDLDEGPYLEPESLINSYNESVFEDAGRLGHDRHITLIRRIARTTGYPILVEFGAAQALELFNPGKPLDYEHLRSVVRSIKKSLTPTKNGKIRYDLKWHKAELDPTVNDWVA